MATKQDLEKYIKEKREAVLVVNTHSRKGRTLFFNAVDLLKARGINLTATYPVHDPVRLPEVVQEAIQRGGKLIIVGGGDGTISSIVDQFAYKDIILGLLPLGTGNNFVTRTMGIPKSLKGAVDVIVNGKVVDVDLGEVNGDYFANTASLGFTADVARMTPRYLKRYVGVIAYGIMGLRNIFSRERFKCTIILPDQTLMVHTHQVVVANGSYFGITRLAPDAHVDNRQLVVFTMESFTRWQMVRMWLTFFLGNARQAKEARYFVTPEVTIETDPPQYMNVDGEVTTQTPVRFTVASEALKIMAPMKFEEPLG
jgi:diacylglycerol kinase (ATP)